MKANPLESEVVKLLEDMLPETMKVNLNDPKDARSYDYGYNDALVETSMKIKETARRILEETAQDLKDILNRTKTERGLSTAVANYVKTLTAKEEQS